MGQSTSVQTTSPENTELQLQSGSRDEILNYFNDRAVKQFTRLECIYFKENIGFENFSDTIPEDKLYALLSIDEADAGLKSCVIKIVRRLNAYPFINHSSDKITAYGLLKTILIFQNHKFIKYINSDKLDRLKIIFIAVGATDKDEVKDQMENPELLQVHDVLKNYDSINVQNIKASVMNMLPFLSWLLALSNICHTDNCVIDSKHIITHWELYKSTALCLLRSMNSTLTTVDLEETISFVSFKTSIDSIMVYLFLSVEHLLNHLLFVKSSLVDKQKIDVSFQQSKLMTYGTTAQLAIILRNELLVSKLHKLYTGREHGFSMRSFQAKAFKWNAPTLLLVSGLRILNDTEYGDKKNARYKKFLEEFPKIRDLDQELELCHEKIRRVTYAVYLDEPWKVSNKSLFGGPKVKIIELSSRQDMFNASESNTVYFNTIGGGIGFGNNQPTIKANNVFYSPGNVSLTLDNSLEFAVFRHTGYGGSMEPSALLQKNDKASTTFELRFVIQDLEVWGCGGEKEIDEQLKQWEWEEAESKRRQQINLKSMGEDRALLEMAGIIGNHGQSGGSV